VTRLRPGSVACAQQAIYEFADVDPGIKVELLSADHQNEPDIGVGIEGHRFHGGRLGSHQLRQAGT
jgi:hypothetical protein